MEAERQLLQQLLSLLQQATPEMQEMSMLTDALKQLDELFLLVVVGEFNSGKSSVINALLGSRYANTLTMFNSLFLPKLHHVWRLPHGQCEQPCKTFGRTKYGATCPPKRFQRACIVVSFRSALSHAHSAMCWPDNI